MTMAAESQMARLKGAYNLEMSDHTPETLRIYSFISGDRLDFQTGVVNPEMISPTGIDVRRC